MRAKIEGVYERFDFNGQSGLLQYWDCKPSHGLEDSGYNLTVKDQPFRSTQDHNGLGQYRMTCLEYGPRYVGPKQKVDPWWLAGRVIQTGVADHRIMGPTTIMGGLALPVIVRGAIVGIIELVTTLPKKSYVEDYYQICSLLQDENLGTRPMEKVMKAEYKGEMIKFSLPFDSGITKLNAEVKKRIEKIWWLKKLNRTTFCIKYKASNGKVLLIESDRDLQFCIADSSSMGTIKLLIEDAR